MVADEQQVAPTPPWREQPKHGNELAKPEGPVQRAKVLGLQAGDDCLYDEQAHQAEEHVGTDHDPTIYGERYDERRWQRYLRDDPARRMRDMHRGSVEGQGVEDQQAPRDADPA